MVQNPRASRRGYVIALIVFVLGSLGGAALVAVFAYGLFGLGDDLERMIAPGSEQFELSDTGTYTIYYEYRSRIDGTDYDTDQSTPGLDISITRIADNTDVPVSPSLMSTSYSLTNHAGRSIRTFQVDEPGSYEITVDYREGEAGSDVILAVGQGVVRGIFMSIGAFLGAGVVFCMMTILAIAIAGITFYRRYQAGHRPVT